jgi:hypothetical protein
MRRVAWLTESVSKALLLASLVVDSLLELWVRAFVLAGATGLQTSDPRL